MCGIAAGHGKEVSGQGLTLEEIKRYKGECPLGRDVTYPEHAHWNEFMQHKGKDKIRNLKAALDGVFKVTRAIGCGLEFFSENPSAVASQRLLGSRRTPCFLSFLHILILASMSLPGISWRLLSGGSTQSLPQSSIVYISTDTSHLGLPKPRNGSVFWTMISVFFVFYPPRHGFCLTAARLFCLHQPCPGTQILPAGRDRKESPKIYSFGGSFFIVLVFN